MAVVIRKLYKLGGVCVTSQSVRKLHVPVMAEMATHYLDVKATKVFIDMTFGAGGHSKLILESCKDVKIFALDRDPVAHKHACLLSEQYPTQIVPLLGKFSDVPKLLSEHDIGENSVDGILFDFGCSSMQFDEAERGFSLSQNGPLDMRMDKSRIHGQITAAELINNLEEDDLAKILKVYGEEKNSKKIARAIVEARSTVLRIETTKQLADLVESCVSGGRYLDKLQRPSHPATKTFQALRIFVNNELNELNFGLLMAHKYLKTTGRLVTITFHSLEDTIVKRHINGNIIQGVANSVPLKYSNHATLYEKTFISPLLTSNWKQLHKHVLTPEDKEVSKNPRSRSAKLRAAIKVQ